jgi:Zn-dependent M32 family carboxypeptidase
VVPDEGKDELRLLKDRLATTSDVQAIQSLLLRDQQTCMPAGGVAGRAEQLAPARVLRENIHRHGGRYYPDELIEQVTGSTLDIAPYLRYLQGKFGELYGPS